MSWLDKTRHLLGESQEDIKGEKIKLYIHSDEEKQDVQTYLDELELTYEFIPQKGHYPPSVNVTGSKEKLITFLKGMKYNDMEEDFPYLFESVLEEVAKDAGSNTQRNNTMVLWHSMKDKISSAKKVVDFGCGFGLSKAVYGNKIITYEPFPSKSDKERLIAKGSGIPSEWIGKGGNPQELIDYKGLKAKDGMVRKLRGTIDLVLCNFVLNVIPSVGIRMGIVEDISKLLKVGGEAVITTRSTADVGSTEEVHEDGYIFSKGKSNETFQKGFSKSELKTFIEETLEDSVENFEFEDVTSQYKPTKQPKILIRRVS